MESLSDSGAGKPQPTFRLQEFLRDFSSPAPAACVGAPVGLRPDIELFPHQSVSLARMLRLERPNRAAQLAVPATGDSAAFLCRGGILCEHMGTGKTLICIALVLSTRGAKSAVPAPFAPRFDRVAPLADDDGDGGGGGGEGRVAGSARVPPLRLLAAERCRLLFDHRDASVDVPFDVRELLDAASDPYFLVPPPRANRTSKRVPELPPTRVLVSHATLIVVPENLVDHWASEFRKFVANPLLTSTAADVLEADQDWSLRVLLCRDTKSVPTAELLVRFDVVVVSQEALRHESTAARFVPAAWQTCTYQCEASGCGCPSCRRPPPASELTKVSWLRVIVDESHFVGRFASLQTSFVAGLFAERWWCCSGTPILDKDDLKTELEYLYGIVKFLRVQPWCELDVWRREIAQGLVAGDAAATSRLTSLLGSLLVRNRFEDVRPHINLPDVKPLEGDTIETAIEMMARERVRYNQFLAFDIANRLCPGGKPETPANRLMYLLLACTYTPGIFEKKRRATLRLIASTIWNLQPKAESGDEEAAETCRKLRTAAGFLRIVNAHALVNPEEVLAPLGAVKPGSLNEKKYFEEFEQLGLWGGHSIDSRDSDAEPAQRPPKKQRRSRPADADPDSVDGDEQDSSDESAVRAPEGSPGGPWRARRRKLRPAAAPSSSQQSMFSAKVGHTEEYYVEHSAKLRHVMRRLRSMPPDAKVILFSHHSDNLRRLQDICLWSRIPALEYVPSTSREERSEVLLQFERCGGLHVLIMQTDLAAFGINLPSATHLLFLEPTLDTKLTMQAIARPLRANRGVQRKTVYVEVLYGRGSVEELVLRLAQAGGKPFRTREQVLDAVDYLSLLDEDELVVEPVPAAPSVVHRPALAVGVRVRRRAHARVLLPPGTPKPAGTAVEPPLDKRATVE